MTESTKEMTDFDVLQITTAYEQGFGHAFRDELSNPYPVGKKTYLAWSHGREVGKRRGTPWVPLIRDLAELLDLGVPAVCRALVELGFQQKSTNMEVSLEEMIAVKKHFAEKKQS